MGSLLTRHFLGAGHDVVVLSRAPRGGATPHVAWDAKTLGPWTSELDGCDVVINLAGRSVDCRYSDANRRAIMDSRVESTRVVGRAIAAAKQPPPLWLQASTATIYGHRFDAPNDEATNTGLAAWAIPGRQPRGAATTRISLQYSEELQRRDGEPGIGLAASQVLGRALRSNSNKVRP